MNRIRNSIILSVMLFMVIQGSLAQTPRLFFVLSAPETLPQRSYVARNYILFKPGFSFTPGSTTAALSARIDPTLTFTVTSNPNPKPGETVTNGTDIPYVPGTTYSEDPVTNVKGLNVSPVYGTQPVSGTVTPSTIYPIIWMKTIPRTNNLNGEYVWKDIVGNSISMKTKNASGVWSDFVTTRDKMRAFNFNPAIDLSANTYAKKIDINTTNLAQATVIGVWGVKSDYTQDRFLMTLQGRPNDWAMISKQAVTPSATTSQTFSFGGNAPNFMFQSTIDGTEAKFHEKSLRIGAYYKASTPNHSVWSEAQNASMYFGVKEDTVSPWSGMSGMQGYMPEMLVFGQHLRETDILKYTTYLALKYGISLDTSYVSASGQTIWDYTNNAGFNNRITGYGREDDLGFYQKVSTTSYEEAPYFSDLSQYDSNDSADSYQASSRYRLLTIGLQHANPINNGRYFIYGDNGGSVSQSAGAITGYPIVMGRKWRLQTNTNTDAATNKVLTWSKYGQSLEFYKKYTTNNYRSDLVKTSSSDSAVLVTSTPLAGKNGYLAWTVDVESGPVIAKFGTSTPYLSQNEHDYGYRIDINGNVSKVYKGKVEYYLFTVNNGQRLEIEKNEKLIYLKVDGIRYKGTEFLLDPADVNKSYYGAIIMGSNPYDFKLIDFRHGGFVNTGHRVELSYDTNRASVFTDPTLGKVFMLIDPTGNGDFTSGLLSYACDEVDVAKKKLIFNNVYFDTNATGTYDFTFAYSGAPPVLRSYRDTIPSVDDKEIDEPIKDDVQIYSRKEGGNALTSVRLQLAKPSIVTIMIYDLSGRRVAQSQLIPNEEVTTTDFKLPANGIYIVKVVTKTHQYIQEILAK